MTDPCALAQPQGVTNKQEPPAVPPRTPSAPCFRALFLEHASYVASSLRRLGVRDRDLEDLTHDVFLAVYRHLEDYDPARPIKPWLFGFAAKVASGHRRRKRYSHEIIAADIEAGGYKLLGTSAIMANEIFIANLQPLKAGEEKLAFSCALLVVSALMIRSVLQMHSAPLGFETKGIYTGRVGLPPRDWLELRSIPRVPRYTAAAGSH